MTNTERALLKKLADGDLDGCVGDEFVTGDHQNVYCGKYIKNGIPCSYREGEGRRHFDGRENVYIPGKRSIKKFETDEEKLLFLQNYGFLIDDDEVRTYSSAFKYRFSGSGRGEKR